MDQELIARCLQGDEEAWATITEMIRRLVGSLTAVGRLRNSIQEPEDIAQEVQIQLLRNHYQTLRRFSGHSRLSTYLGAIVVRVAVRLRQEPESLWAGEFDPVDDLPDTGAAEFARSETWTAIEQTLPPFEVLILRLEAAGYTAAEIAAMLSRLTGRPWHAATVRQRKARAVRRLRRALSEAGTNLDDR